MKCLVMSVFFGVAFVALATGCGGGSSDPAPITNDPVVQATGSISISLTDGPWEDAQAVVLHITGIELGHANNEVIQLQMPGGPMSIDMMQLQNGMSQALISAMTIPIGQYEWMRLLDLCEIVAYDGFVHARSIVRTFYND